MHKNTNKPTPEAKALSLFLMAYKTKNPLFKEHAKRINRQWDLVKAGELKQKDYNKEVLTLLNSFGGYQEVIEKTVRYYLKKTGEWNLKGNDQYCIDAQKIVDRIKSSENQ